MNKTLLFWGNDLSSKERLRFRFGCRKTKLLSQKRRYTAIFCISFLWQRGTYAEKRRDYEITISKKPSSSSILHRSNCNRLLLGWYDFLKTDKSDQEKKLWALRKKWGVTMIPGPVLQNHLEKKCEKIPNPSIRWKKCGLDFWEAFQGHSQNQSRMCLVGIRISYKVHVRFLELPVKFCQNTMAQF